MRIVKPDDDLLIVWMVLITLASSVGLGLWLLFT
jgi:hypothetical protein